jgi:hypothetical protein
MRIQYKLYDTNLLSGSSDAFRNSVGGYYTVMQSTASVNDTYLEFIDTEAADTDVFGESVIGTDRASLIDKVLIQFYVSILCDTGINTRLSHWWKHHRRLCAVSKCREMEVIYPRRKL